MRNPIHAPPISIRSKLTALGLSPRKALGQHFMTDRKALDKILVAAELDSSDTVVEIGPGLGVLTEELVQRVARVVAIELDADLGEALKRVYGSSGNLKVISGDAREIDPEGLVGKRPYKLVANLPYYAASFILRHFLEAKRKPTLMVVTVQKEVGENIAATPGALGLLGVSVQVYGKPEIVDYILPGAFYPPPKVLSAIVKIRVYPKPLFQGDMWNFFSTVKAGFSAPRKQLKNALSHGLDISTFPTEEALLRAGIEPTRRAETLTVEEWGSLTNALLSSTR